MTLWYGMVDYDLDGRMRIPNPKVETGGRVDVRLGVDICSEGWREYAI